MNDRPSAGLIEFPSPSQEEKGDARSRILVSHNRASGERQTSSLAKTTKKVPLFGVFRESHSSFCDHSLLLKRLDQRHVVNHTKMSISRSRRIFQKRRFFENFPHKKFFNMNDSIFLLRHFRQSAKLHTLIETIIFISRLSRFSYAGTERRKIS